MDKVYESGASAAPPVPPAIPSMGYPSRGNPATGTMPTVPGPYMMHQLVEELMAVIAAANIVPDKLVLNQLKLALDAVYVKRNGTSPILQNFPGLTRSLTALGGGLVREYVDIPNAATVGGIEICTVYNCAIDPVSGVWAGRDIADICWMEKWHDVAGTKEFWFSATGAASSIPVWTKVFSLDMVGGGMYLAQEAGHVAFFARPTAPAGYLKANGALISRATYANLFAAIGTTFGVGDGLTTFALPDLRGEFLRGFDDARGVDTGRTLGSAQLGTLQVIDPSLTSPGIGVPLHGNDLGANIYADAGLDVVAAAAYPNMTSSTIGGTVIALTAGGWAIGASRPRNIALLACIKY